MNTSDQPKSWHSWYVLVLLALLAEIVFFAWITHHFSA
jgi:hypothetical protein